MTFTPFSSFLLLAQLPLTAAFSFSPSPDLQSFIISVIQGSPSTRCNICLDVLHMSCWRDSTKWTDWEHFHLFTSAVGSSRACQLVMNLINCAGLILFCTRLVWRKFTHCCSPVKHSVIYYYVCSSWQTLLGFCEGFLHVTNPTCADDSNNEYQDFST